MSEESGDVSEESGDVSEESGDVSEESRDVGEWGRVPRCLGRAYGTGTSRGGTDVRGGGNGYLRHRPGRGWVDVWVRDLPSPESGDPVSTRSPGTRTPCESSRVTTYLRDSTGSRPLGSPSSGLRPASGPPVPGVEPHGLDEETPRKGPHRQLQYSQVP